MALLGSVQSMITTLKNNSRKKEKTHFNNTGVSGSLEKLSKKKMTPEELLKFRKDLKKKKKREIIKGLIVFFISAILTVLFLYIILNF